jgi:K+-sensing histidine kinase KdpD
MNLNLKASNYMDSAIQICKELNIPAEMIKLKQTKYEIDSANSNWRAALKDLADISTLKDSLYNVNSIVANKELIAKYETEKIEREKSILLETQRIYKIAIAIAIILLAFILLLLVKKRQQNKKLNELVIFRNKIQTIISHDFRSPLFALQGLYEQANYFIEKKDLVQLKKLSTNIDETSNRIGSLLKNLITWAESSKTSFYKKNKISLYKKTMDTIELYHNILQNKNIKIHNNINKDLLVNANANVFDLLVRNWLDNLLKYANADTIEITATQKDNEMLISIFDNGVIDQNKMAYIQQQFLNKKDVNINETSSGFGLELMTYFSKKEGWQLNFKAVQDLNEFTIAIPVA